MIECNVNGHTYRTEKLYLKDFKKLGVILEEKIFPLFLTFIGVDKYGVGDKDLLLALYTASKDAFSRDDAEYMIDLVMNKEHLTIDGKKPDTAEWERHWQNVGYIEYRMVAIEFIKVNMGNFTLLSASMPQEWTMHLKNILNGIFLNSFESQNVQ